MIVGEMTGSGLSAQTSQLFGAIAKSLPGSATSAVFLSDSIDGRSPHLKAIPVSKVYLAEHAALKPGGLSGFDSFVDVLEAICSKTSPHLVLFMKSDFGANVASLLGARLGVAVAPDCTAIAVTSEGAVTVTRPVYGGSAVAEFELRSQGTNIVIVRPGAYEGTALSGGSPEIEDIDTSGLVREQRVKVIDVVAEVSKGVRLEDARTVVSGGRGLGGKEPFRQLQELADLLGGAVGASRAACDAGWIDHSHQVGLTGKTVVPNLYLAVGISGASQHMAGCAGAGTIVAINRDKESNIFKEARFGVAGDWQKVIPAFIATVRDLGKA